MRSIDDGVSVRTGLLRLLFAQKACGQSRCAFISAQLAAIAAVPAEAPDEDVVAAALRSALSVQACTRACPTQAHVSLSLTRLHEQVCSRNAPGAANHAEVPVSRTTTVPPKALTMVPPATRQIRLRRGQA